GFSPSHAGWRAGRFPAFAMLRRSHVMRQIEGGIDERHVREGLGKVTEETARGGIVLRRQEAHVVAGAEESLEGLASVVVSAHEPVVVGQREGAGEKCALARRQSVDAT